MANTSTTDPRRIDISGYDYDLPEARIAKYPLEQRDASRLLVYRDGQVRAQAFRTLSEELPSGALLVFNNTKVIHARLRFTLPSGKPLEIFCLDPVAPAEHQRNFSSRESVRWKCLIGGNRRWKSGVISMSLPGAHLPVELTAHRLERLEDTFEVAFSWTDPQLSFGELLAAAGIIPLPPYLNREAERADSDRYQTIYARHEGSVAAPTAGLHFTDSVMADLKTKGIGTTQVTLHVGAGTFKPVSSPTLAEHAMHAERISVDRATLQLLHDQLAAGRPIIAVGTTSMRTLESLYWHGARLLRQPAGSTELAVSQWEPYETTHPPPATEALAALLHGLEASGQNRVEGQTHIIIAPGYRPRIVEGLITNFHQPRSTLLLLVAALIGEDWRRVYEFALENDFRFLSYGDSSLLWKAG